jgi:diamine N-acetyltransferase
MGLATAAMLICFQFFFKAMGFHKLYSFVYEDNPHSLKGTLHLGFQQEGVLREHIMDPATGRYVNLIQTGLLASEVDSKANHRLMERLLK